MLLLVLFLPVQVMKKVWNLLDISEESHGSQYLPLANLQILDDPSMLVWFPMNLHLNQPREEGDLPVQPTTFHLGFNASDFYASSLSM